MSDRSAERLDEGIESLGTVLSSAARERLLAFVALLQKWNRAYNLTAVRDPEAMVTRHLLDALSILPWIEGPDVLDVGSGGGIPGLVVAIARPEVNITSIDSNGKKIRFQRQAIFELGIDNAEAVHSRIEQFEGRDFHQIISRAFAAPGDFVALTRHLLAPGGHWLAMIGRMEEASVPETVRLVETRALRVPGEQGQRHLMKLETA